MSLSSLVDKPLIQNPLAGGSQLGGLNFRQEGDMGRYVADNDPGGVAAGFSNLQDYLAAGNKLPELNDPFSNITAPGQIPDRYKKGFEEFYKQNPECEVVVNSNLKKLPDAWKIIISKFKNITIVCSCDAIDILGEYVRYPIQWNEFTKNVDFVSKNANHLQFNLVASNLTAHKIYETCLWMKNYSNNIDITVLDKPTHFSEKAVPYDVRNIYLENLQKCLKFPINVFMASQYRTRIQYLIKKYKAENYDKNLHMQLKAEIIEQDSHRKLQIKDVDPFLYDWIFT